MTYSFTEKLFKQGNRHFIEIPFNVWEECSQKGLIPVKVYIKDISFECKLISKGKGVYYIPITKGIINQFDSSDEISISFKIIEGLTRINHDSPYTLDNPIRKICEIKQATYPKDGYCGQICIAMLTGLSVDEIVDIIQARAWQCSLSKLVEALDYFGISHKEKVIYTKGKEVVLPECCIVNVRNEHKNHFVLCFKGKYYDTANFSEDKIISYLAINI